MPQVYSPDLEDMDGAMSFVLRVTGAPAGLMSAVRRVVAEVEPNQALYNVMTMEQRLANTTTSRRLNTALLGSFAAVALLLAVVGIYGVMSYAVTQRTREIGMRMALGAERRDVLRLVLARALRIVGAGLIVGLAGAAGVTRVLQTFLFGVTPTDPIVFTIVTLLLLAVGLMAAWLPARRAARIDPIVALRQE